MGFQAVEDFKFQNNDTVPTRTAKLEALRLSAVKTSFTALGGDWTYMLSDQLQGPGRMTPETRPVLTGGKTVEADIKDSVWEFSNNATLGTRSWLAVDDGSNFRAAYKVRLMEGGGWVPSVGFFLYDVNGYFLSDFDMVAAEGPIETSDGWITLESRATTEDIKAAYPDAAYVRSFLYPGERPATVQIASAKIEDLTFTVGIESAVAAAEQAAADALAAALAGAGSAETAAGYANTAHAWADEATGQAGAAQASAVAAQSFADDADVNAQASATHASSALTSANDAGASAAAAEISRIAAEAANTSSTTQAGIATTKAAEANASAANALSSETLSSTYAGNAASSAGAAAGSASAASSSATAASGSATSASGSAATATTQAGLASTYAGNANTSAGNAATSATAANNAKTAAEAAKASAETASTLSATYRDQAQDNANRLWPFSMAPGDQAAYALDPSSITYVGPNAAWPTPYMVQGPGGTGPQHSYVRFLKMKGRPEAGRRIRVTAWFYNNGTNNQSCSIWALTSETGAWDGTAAGFGPDVNVQNNNSPLNTLGFMKVVVEFVVSASWKATWTPVCQFTTTGGPPNSHWHVTPMLVEDITDLKVVQADVSSNALAIASANGAIASLQNRVQAGGRNMIRRSMNASFAGWTTVGAGWFYYNDDTWGPRYVTPGQVGGYTFVVCDGMIAAAGGEYTASADASAGGTTGIVYVEIQWLIGGTWYSGPTNQKSGGGYSTNQSSRLRVTGTAPSGTTQVRIALVTYNKNGQCEFRQAQVEPGGVMSAYNEQSATTETMIAVDGMLAKWGVEVNVAGRITGRVSLSASGTRSNFSIEADYFEIYKASGERTTYANNAWKVIDAGGVTRVQLGNLSA